MIRERRAAVCGVDEAGRGPWAGPVFAAAVILSPRQAIPGLNDSKKLSASQRETLEPQIKSRARAWGIGSASVEEIDSLNILLATGLAMWRAIEALGAAPALALVDGNYAFSLPCPVETVVNGDATHEVIAAASILAKTARDRVMVEMDARHPGYGFAAHKGYGVPAHAQALAALGPCAIHRVSFSPIRALVSHAGLIGTFKIDRSGDRGAMRWVMADPSHLVRALRLQAQACVTFGSVFSGDLLQRAADDVEYGGPTAALLAPWMGETTRALFTDAVPVRLLGAWHDLALSGTWPALGAAYPTPDRPGDADRAWNEVRALIAELPERIAGFMAHEPQTNEVRRSACLIGGFLTVAKETGLPLRCFEVGASAGLNQLWDRFRYQLGDVAVWGDPGSPVVIDTDWRGAAPPADAEVRVIERAACDRKPVDLADATARRRLRAYVWADQIDRLQRLEAAISLALAQGVRVDTDDAVTWTVARAHPQADAATVLYHSVFWQYMPLDSQAALTAAILGHGAAATARAPFAWLRMEPPPDNLAAMELRLTLWPGGEERLLALVHPHGAQVTWGEVQAS